MLLLKPILAFNYLGEVAGNAETTRIAVRSSLLLVAVESVKHFFRGVVVTQNPQLPSEPKWTKF